MVPADMLEVMRKSDDQPDRTEFTPSSLLECDRRSVLRNRNTYWLDVEKVWNLHRGGLIHELIENHGSYPEGSVVDVLREVRLTTKVETKYGPQVFSGKSDCIVIQRIEDGVAYVKVVDYKTSSITHDLTAPSREHEMQLNMYAWLVQKELMNSLQAVMHLRAKVFEVQRVEITELELVIIDMRRVRRFTSAGPLYDKGKQISRTAGTHETLTLEPIFMLDPEITGDWIVGRIEEKIRAKEELPPPLEGELAQKNCPYCPVRDVCFNLAGKSL